MDTTKTKEDIKKYIAPFKSSIKRKGKDSLPFDYLVPAGPYEEQWDWDAFFIGMALSAEIPSEAIFLRNWALNYIVNADEKGYVPGNITPEGHDPRLKQMKPLLAQGCYFASKNLNDFSWLQQDDRYEKLKRIVLYRENYGCWNAELGLGGWTDSMESGADNNLASLDYPENSVASVDFNCFLYMEYQALSLIADKLGNTDNNILFAQKAEDLKNAILNHMWSEEDSTFYNINLEDKSFIKVITYSSAHPFWAKIASQEQADAFFKRWFLNKDEMKSEHGIRTLTKTHKGYNNINMIKPHSNWQGPIWPIASYIYIQSLMNYGYKEEATEEAVTVSQLCINDIKESGGMHENYDAETGLPLAAPNFVSWNLLLVNVLEQIEKEENPFLL